MTENANLVQRSAAFSRAARQEQFLDVVSRDEAQARLHRHLRPAPSGVETVPLSAARGRVLAEDVQALVDVPGFDRASVDGFAVRAADIAGVSPETPATLRVHTEILTPGVPPQQEITEGSASIIATGGMLPRGADTVVMIEDTETKDVPDEGPMVEIRRPAFAGRFVAAAGSDIARGETVLRQGCLLTSREIGMLAAVGLVDVPVWHQPRVAILSTGDEIIAPGTPIRAGQVYDSNAAVLSAATEELGGIPISMGIVPDDEAELIATLDRALAAGDMVILSGGTSKGAGDIAYRAVARLTDPGLIVHGVAVKPGKPLCLAVSGGKLVAILPGFPTSAMFTFHSFIAPVITALAGRRAIRHGHVAATLPVPVTSERGRTEYVMVSLMRVPGGGLAAYPTAKNSGAVTSFGLADGFFEIPAASEAIAAGTAVDVTLIGQDVEPADLVVIGSHCVGLDMLIGVLEREGLRVKSLNVGSSGGLAAARRGECDIAGVHLMDPSTGRYNIPFLTDELTLVPGYRRRQGVVFRKDDLRFPSYGTAQAAIAAALADATCLMVNRNSGSGTRILIDRLLGGNRPPGYGYQAKSHNGSALAVLQHRADWGMAIETVARQYGLGFLPLQDEQYDFILPLSRRAHPAVRRFVALLHEPAIRAQLVAMGFTPQSEAVNETR